jgi:nucleotidyltransferase/DNA polymerase involved in DNA repair
MIMRAIAPAYSAACRLDDGLVASRKFAPLPVGHEFDPCLAAFSTAARHDGFDAMAERVFTAVRRTPDSGTLGVVSLF